MSDELKRRAQAGEAPIRRASPDGAIDTLADRAAVAGRYLPAGAVGVPSAPDGTAPGPDLPSSKVPPSVETIDWLTIVQSFGQPEDPPVYEFSGGRTFSEASPYGS